jgi:ABC-type glutathione transport system ATPase component
MMSSAILNVEGLTLVSDGGIIVNNLSFEVLPGEIVALTGKSGSGKTSIALSILNLLPPGIHMRQGSIRWTGNPGKEMILPANAGIWKQLRGKYIGYTHQDAYGAFDPVMTMGKQMMLIVRERSSQQLNDLEKELQSKMEEVGLNETGRLWASYPHQLSGGQLQRCQIAMAIVIGPQLLIADEPTSAIDKINQLELLDVFSMVRRKYNMAILCITHEEVVVNHLADREIKLESFPHSFIASQLPLKQTTSTYASTILEVKDLEYTHAYGGLMRRMGASIGKVDFILKRSECIGIVGESGSGKSTLAQLLVGLFRPSNGKVIVEGRQIDFKSQNDIEYLRAKVQLVMQDGRGALHPYLTIGEILNEIARVSKKSNPDDISDLSLRLSEVGLPQDVLERRASQLSGGECLRVSIARAMLMQPEVLICDESTSALDGPTRDGIIKLLGQLMQQRGLALIFISHDEHVIRSLADEVMVMDAGKIVEKGLANQVIRHPSHAVSRKIFNLYATHERN